MIYTHALNPVFLELGPVQLRWYGLMYVLGFVGAYFFSKPWRNFCVAGGFFDFFRAVSDMD